MKVFDRSVAPNFRFMAENALLDPTMTTRFADLVPANPDGSCDAIAWSLAVIADGMRSAREAAGLTQEELAARLRRPLKKIVKTEAAEWEASVGHINQVLRVCGLPPSWKATT